MSHIDISTKTDLYDLFSLDICPQSFMHEAARDGDLLQMEYFVEQRKANVNRSNEEGRKPLHDAAEAGQTEIVKFLLDNGAKLCSQTNRRGVTPLHLAIESGHKDLTSYLLEKGAHRHKNKCGKTALHIAAENGEVEIMGLLIKERVDLFAKTYDGKTAYDLAIAAGHLETAAILEKLMAHYIYRIS